MYLNYISNFNENKNLNLIKNEIETTIDKYNSEKTSYMFSAFIMKIALSIKKYTYIYPQYSKSLVKFSEICNNSLWPHSETLKYNHEQFIEEFKKEINNCNDLFILFLFKEIF